MKPLRYSGVTAVAMLAIIAAFLAWEAAFASLVGLQTHSWALWSRFYHGLEWSLPIRTAYAQWSAPLVRKISEQAWLAALVAGAGVSFGILEIAQNFRGVRPPAGGSRLATRSDLKRAELLNGKPGYSVFLGRYQGRDLRYSGASHIYVNGPTRSGKGVGFVLPNALEWRGSLIGLDLKREMWNEIGAARAAMGQDVFLFSPGSPESHCWNPLDLVSPWPMRATDVSNIARSLIPLPASGDPYWAETARGLFAGLLAYVLESKSVTEGRTIKSALKMFSRGHPLHIEMANVLKRELTLSEFIRDKFRQHIGREEKARQSFESHVITALDAWNNSLVDASTSRSDFNIANLRRKPFTILIGTPIGNFGSVEAVVRLLIQQVHDVLLRSLPGLDEPHRLLLMLDEFFQFGRMPEIVDRSPLVAGYGFQIAVIAQGLTQLDVRYGRPTRDMMIGNMDVKLLIGVGDEVTASYCSEELGDKYVRHEAWGTSKGSRGGSQTRQGRWELEQIMPSDTMRRLDPRKAVLLVRGHPGAVIDKAFMFRDRLFVRQIAAARPFASKLTIPKVGAGGAQSPAGSAPRPRGGLKHEIARTKVMDAARDIFQDAARFEDAFVKAMNEAGSDAIAALCKLLRTDPKQLGELKDRKRSRFRRAEPPDVLTTKLRTEIIAARRLLNDTRAEFVATALSVTAAANADDFATLVPHSASPHPGASVDGKAAPAEAGADVAGVVANFGVHSGAIADSLRTMVAIVSKDGVDDRLTRYVGELENQVALFVDTPEDLAQVMTE
ncbi:MAG TPA: type IV secretory system conjugative DNA transfer family protein [Roseiarcus sp.]|jgi:type IV secretion system protein VirD4